MLTRESFLAAYAVQPEIQQVGDCFVRAMTAGEKDRVDAAHTKSDGRDFRARLLASGVCDQDGKLLFSEADIPALNNMPLPTIEPFVEAVLSINKMGKDEREAIRKNLISPSDEPSSAFVTASGELNGSSATSSAVLN